MINRLVHHFHPLKSYNLFDDLQLKAVEGVVNDVEKILKMISDDILSESTKGTTT